jgi:hypothetical protein
MQHDDRLDVYLAVGHGVEPSGIFDPGAIGTDGRQEHMEAFQVCTYALAAMRRSGLTVTSETAQGASHDPDYRGSAVRANQLNPRVAIEVHFDWSGGVPGYSGLYFSDQGHALAQHVGSAFAARGLPRAADVRRPELFFLNSTNMPALIPEINRVQNFPDSVNQAQGEALAEGTCAFLGQPFTPAGGTTTARGTGAHGAITPDSRLLAPARAPESRAEQYLLARPHGDYSAADVTRIVGLYYENARAARLDPLLAVAQMAEETAHLTSFWSQRPRRNLAGIGVTGAPGIGLSFPDLKTAVRAHIGRLLAYALPDGTGNQAQHQLITEALAARPLDKSLLGIAPTLKGLAGHWAGDPEYAGKIAAVANAIRKHGS